MIYHDLASLTECPEDGWVKYLCFTSPKRKCSKGNGAQDVQVIDETVDFGSLFDGGQLPTLIPMWGGLGVRSFSTSRMCSFMMLRRQRWAGFGFWSCPVKAAIQRDDSFCEQKHPGVEVCIIYSLV